MDVYQRRRLVALSALAGIFILFVLLIRSCGGDDESSTEPLAAGASGASGAAGPSVLAQADYIAQADPICLQANTSLDDVDESDPVQADSDKAQIVSGELQQLQSLPPPDDGTDKLDKFLSELQKQSAAYQDRSTASERGDDAQVAELTSTLEKSQGEAADTAKAFGFKVCGDLGKVGEATSTGGGGGGGGGTETPTTDTGGTVTPTEPVTPTTTTPVPVAPPDTDSGTVSPTPAPAPPTDGGTGGTGGSSGGVSP